MNSTNRGANRFLLLITAIVLLAAAVAALTLATLPAIVKAWGTQSSSIMSSAPDWVGKSAVGTVSLLTIGIGVVAIILAILLIVFVVNQGRGHTSRVLEQHGTAGATLIDLGVPRTLLDQDLSERPEFVSTRISAYQVKNTPTLKISVQCRRGVSPIDAARTVTRSLATLDQILGEPIPALVQISGGFRSRVTSRARLD